MSGRQCQPCTACCDGWVRIEVNGFEASPGHPCPHSTGKGCDDYENRPVDPCINFICGWRQDDSPLPDWLKPSNAKMVVIFDKLSWRGRPVDLAVPVGPRIPQRAINWLAGYAEANGRVFLYTEQVRQGKTYAREQNVYAVGPPDFKHQVADWLRAGIKLW